MTPRAQDAMLRRAGALRMRARLARKILGRTRSGWAHSPYSGEQFHAALRVARRAR